MLMYVESRCTIAACSNVTNQNVFWKVRNANLHQVISYDLLHADDCGFWGDHLFTQIKARVMELGRSAIVKIDVQYIFLSLWVVLSADYPKNGCISALERAESL